jgi:hypothetical protein
MEGCRDTSDKRYYRILKALNFTYMMEVFKQFSVIVCADESISNSLSKEYYDLFSKDVNFLPLLTDFKKIIDSNPSDIVLEICNNILSNSAYKNLVKEIIKLWYLGKIDRLGELKGNDHYFHYDALIWKVLHAHPTGLTGGYYGYWSYKPEN